MQKTPVNRSGIVTLNEQIKALGIVSPVPVGNWLAQIKYQKLNIVRHNGGAYIAKTSSINVEPGVAQNWLDVWLLLAIDGGAVSPDGTYPNMTVGTAITAQNSPIWVQISIESSMWSDNSVVLSAANYEEIGNITTTNYVYFIPNTDSVAVVINNKIRLSAQGDGTATFSCEATPSQTVNGILVIQN